MRLSCDAARRDWTWFFASEARASDHTQCGERLPAAEPLRRFDTQPVSWAWKLGRVLLFSFAVLAPSMHAFTTCMCGVPSRSKEEGVISPLFSVHHRSLSVFSAFAEPLSYYINILRYHVPGGGASKSHSIKVTETATFCRASHARANRFAAWSSASRAMSLDARCTSPLRS